MKKILLVVCIITQSFFGLSQKLVGRVARPLPILEGDHVVNSDLVCITNDGNNLYTLSSSYDLIFKHNIETLEATELIQIKYPKNHENGYYPQVKGGMVVYGNFIYIGMPQMGKIYKINKNTGEFIKSIPGPPVLHEGQFYGGLDFDGKYFWVIRNSYKSYNSGGNNYTMMFKLSQNGNIISKYKISEMPVFGLDKEKNNVWMIHKDKNLVSTLKKYSLSKKKFIETHSNPINGIPSSISVINDYFYTHTGTMIGCPGIFKLEYIRE